MGEFDVFVGIDWGSEEHQVCILGPGEGSREKRVVHSGGALRALLDELSALGAAERIAVGLETKSGPIVEAFLDRGFAVFAINPKQLDRFRDRYSPSGAKDDRRDAEALARALVTDRDAFHRVKVDEPWVVRMRELSRIAEELTYEVQRLGNQLRAQLERYYPQVLGLVSTMDEPWLWDLLEEAPTPERGARLRAAVIKRILRENRIRRLTVDDVLAALKQPGFDVTAPTIEAASEHVLLLVPRLAIAKKQRTAVEARIQKLLDEVSESAPGQKSEHRDVRILQSVPGMGRIVIAAVLGEASQLIAERNYHGLRTLAGSAPVTRQTGRQKFASKGAPRPIVTMRRACNARLRRALFLWAKASIQRDPASRHYYDSIRQRGHGHARALRAVGDRWLRIVIGMLRSGTEYEPARLLAA